jgi:hypothetical protein
MAGQLVYSNGGIHQVDFECNRRHWGAVVARQRIWIVPFHLPRSRRVAGTADLEAVEKSASRLSELPVWVVAVPA